MRLVILAGLPVLAVAAQTGPDWRKVGSSAVEMMLASPATGPVGSVWFSADGTQLYARTLSGRVFQTSDFETWVPAETSAEPARLLSASVARLPEADAQTVITPANPARIYGLGRQLSRSDDGGLTWVCLTSYKSQSVVGAGQHGLALSPLDADQLVIANDYGVWRSMDGGLTWSGLNQFLPNLAVRRILSTPSGAAGIRILVDGIGAAELPPGGAVWSLLPAVTADRNSARLREYSQIVGAEVTAVGIANDTLYAGSADGRIWRSLDGGRSFPYPAWETAGGRVEQIVVDPAEPRVALAALAGSGPHVLRTTNSGTFWDPLDSATLPNAPAHGVAMDRAAGAVYVATDRGVFYGQADLDSASIVPVTWTGLTDHLPPSPATDVRLDPAGVQLYIALDGYGVYAAAAPHRRRTPQVVNAADYSTRPAAPGSLLSVIGERVNNARGANLDYPVLAASETESQVQVPFEAGGPSVLLALLTTRGRVTVGLQVQPVSPAILVGRDGVPALFDADSGMPLDSRNTAHSNGRLEIMATGLGKVRPDWPTGLAAPLQSPPVVAAAVRAFLDGSPLAVTRAALAPGYIGFYIIEVQLPPIVNAGSSELYITADGQESNRVRMLLEP